MNCIKFHFINFHVFSVSIDQNKHTHTHTHTYTITHIVISPYIVTSILFSDSTLGGRMMERNKFQFFFLNFGTTLLNRSQSQTHQKNHNCLLKYKLEIAYIPKILRGEYNKLYFGKLCF